ncbi:YhdP family protein [Pusillimonas noertemannii]|uniref:Uncharacterized protein (TIGR02099 family) n=1 Tax=Pusillimonas noertemannii TaxID=305977 RepID=A0A2U1CIU2_9BURK|nr:YhdP family protein [Pusillimonas noertemannii]NYT69962.1 TIGR02099 family protein [Pusillimonas noertemannii]PVY60913.1 uncharacterized protein (TIGR02099 family) [Pusillimonas noertemannii]TFL08427.1 TIGR02099 family protein [Pusillimonas noertemannii]
MFRTSALLRVLGRTALVLYLSVAALFLVVRHGVLPNIDHWRPDIQAALSSALDTRIELGHIEAGWAGLHPRLRLDDVAVFDERGSQVLKLPTIRAVLSWQGLFSGVPSFSYIEASGLDIEARRDAQGRIWALGKEVGRDDVDESPELSLDHPLVQWLARQPRVALRGAAITWRDETRSAAPLRLTAVTLGLASEPGKHTLLLSATPSGALGEGFEMRARFDHADAGLAADDPMAWAGMFYVRIEGMSPAQWRPWLDVPGHMESGRVSAQWWLGFARSRPERVAAQVNIRDGHWRLGEQSTVRASTAELFLDGSWPGYIGALEAFEALAAPEPAPSDATQSEGAGHDRAAGPEGAGHPAGEDGAPVNFWFDAKGMVLNTPEIFDHELAFDHIETRGGLLRDAGQGLAVRFDNARVINRDMDLQWSGSWKEGGSGSGGLADIRGVFHRASLDGIDLYMPTSVNLEAREWLIDGLLDGEIENAAALLQGDLQDFPFGDGPGRFRIEGSFRDGVIDYAPSRSGEESWPALRQVKGRVALDRVDLRLVADEAIVEPAAGHVIELRDVRAHIPDIERDSVLNIEGQTRAPAQAYLALIRHSPLQRLLDGFLDPAQADGEWEVPLGLTIPLLNVDDTRVRGAVRFGGGKLALEPLAPPFEQLRGTLEFSETGFSADGLKASFLNGPASFRGGLGGGRKGLEMSGRIGAEALRQYVGMKGMERLDGTLDYTARMRREPSGRYAMTAQSSLRELAIDLPEPVGKPAGAAGKLEVQWTPASSAGGMILKVALGPTMKAQFLRRRNGKEGPYFVSGAVGTALPKKLPDAGLAVDVRHRRIDVNEWNAIIDEFSAPLPGNAAGGEQPQSEIFPPLQRLRLQADSMALYGLQLEAATLTALRERPLRWRMDVASALTAGTVYWNQADATTAGKVDARFDRLALGDAKAETDSSRDSQPSDAMLEAAEEDGSWDGSADIPAVSLKVDKLTLYGRSVGSLAVEGVNEQQGRFWRLNKLSLASPTAQLHGSGIWRLAGGERGLTLDADASFSDLGAFLDQIDMKNVLEGGKGTIKGRIEWRNMPWRFDRSDLNGQLRFELENGRFSTLNSRSARLLELLSLQSLQRLATFSMNPASIFKEGFPFDRVAGTLHISDGVMTTNDYRVTGPVATISIGGDVDLKTEKIDLQAMVVPRLDVSGATVAAGIAINPIVGLGAFVTQWLLSKPLSKAMTAHYDVSGDLNAPQLNEVSAPTGKSQEAVAPKGRIEGQGVELDDAARNGLHDAGEFNGKPNGAVAGSAKNGR